MCDTCGCPGPDGAVTISRPGAAEHPQGQDHHHSHPHGPRRTIQVEQEVLGRNNRLADLNRLYFDRKKILALNLVSSPGSGKTAVLERTIQALKDELPLAVIEGDQQTLLDAERIEAAGVPVVQINTGAGCHLDAEMIGKALPRLASGDHSILFIENVGNLVCPAMFDLGEAAKVVIISVTEGEDKPQKYPHMFQAADICLINKIDLLPYVDFSMDNCRKYAGQVNPHLRFFELSARTGAGFDAWYRWLREQMQQVADSRELKGLSV